MWLPEKIQDAVGSRDISIETIGMSGAQVICAGDMVLKIEPESAQAANERGMMAWLAGKLPVPEILHAEVVDGVSYLLMSRLEGSMSCDKQWMAAPRNLVKGLAAGLQALWSVDVSDCPWDQSLDVKLRQAEYRVEDGLVDMENVEPDTFGKGGFASPAALLRWLQDNRPEEQNVLSHGDLCLPNVFFRDGTFSAFLDLGRSGVSDPYQDIAICYRSLVHNFDGSYGYRDPGFSPEMLFAELGITPDREKIHYYKLLDELF